MTKKIFVSLSFFFLCINFLTAQTKVSGIVYDEFKQPLPYANVVFKGTTEGIITNEERKILFGIQINPKCHSGNFVGMEPKEVPIEKAVTYNMEINLGAGKMLNEVVIYTGKTSKKNNPAIDILRKYGPARKKTDCANSNNTSMTNTKRLNLT
jgi:hypothetical protein